MRFFWKYLCYIKSNFPIITNLTNPLKPFDSSNEAFEDPNDKTIISDLKESITDQQTEMNYDNISEVLKNVKKKFI